MGIRCPPVWASSGESAAKEHRREVAEESGRGASPRDLNEHP